MIGINTAVAGVGLGLAVPIDATRADHSTLSRGPSAPRLLGIAGGPRPLPPKVRERYPQDPAVEVVDVIEGPPPKARASALATSSSLDGVAVRSASDLQRLMTAERIGAPLAVELVRREAVQTLVAIPGELPSAEASA